MNTKLLGVYLNDHLTGAYGGRALAQRIAGTHPDADGSGLRQLAVDVSDDLDALVELMRGLGLRPATERQPLMRAGEFIGRLKQNGSWLRRTPLTDLVELEMMAAALATKALGWRSLLLLADRDDRVPAERIASLLARAVDQRDLVERLRAAAVLPAFDATSASAADVPAAPALS